MFFNRLLSFLVLSLLLLTNAWSFDEVDFHNVGQGHCVVATSTKGILVIDAGSSSTMGVDGILEEKEGKFQALADKISDSIAGRIKKPDIPLNFIMTHADKDHINLSYLIVEVLLKKKAILVEKVKFILGGKEQEYSTGDATDLAGFLKEKKIPHCYGESFKPLAEGLLWVPPDSLDFVFGPDDISFLSVKSEIASKAPKKSSKPSKSKASSQPPNESAKRNASSIVVRVICKKSSVMITGDKTRPEIANIIAKHEKQGKADLLKSDIVLATHHGSAEDFSPEWLKAVNPAYLVLSCGTSSFFHPRYEAVCSPAVLSNMRLVKDVPWHPVRFFEERGGGADFREAKDKFFPVCLDKPANFRATPYTYAMTNLGIYVTADQGTINFSFNEGKGIVVKASKQHGDVNVVTAFSSFLRSSKEWSKIIFPAPAFLPENIVWVTANCTGLTSLDLGGCNASDAATKDLCDLIVARPSLTSVNLSPNSISEANKRKIIEAWNHRGLTI